MTTLIVQSPQELVMLSEEQMDVARKVYMNVSHPAHPQPQPNGHSIGHWEGNTLIVDTVAFADPSGADMGDHVVERLIKHGNRLDDEVITTDRSGGTRSQHVSWDWRPDFQFNENVCEEGFDRYQVINGQLDNPNIPPSRGQSGNGSDRHEP